MSRTTVVVTPGRHGSEPTPARVWVTSDGPRGRAHLAARILGVHGEVVRIALVAEGALLLAGDEVDLRLQVGEGCRLEVVEPAGTVAYDMRGGTACWRVAVDVENGGQLVWRGEPLVVAGGADVTRAVTVALAGTARARLREVLVLGRAREEGGRIRLSTNVARDGDPVHVEELSLDGARPQVGVLGDLRVVDTVGVFGQRARGIPLPEGAHRLDLEAEATILRSLGAQAHLASLDAVWSALGAPERAAGSTSVTQEVSHGAHPFHPRARIGQNVPPPAARVGQRTRAAAAP